MRMNPKTALAAVAVAAGLALLAPALAANGPALSAGGLGHLNADTPVGDVAHANAQGDAHGTAAADAAGATAHGSAHAAASAGDAGVSADADAKATVAVPGDDLQQVDVPVAMPDTQGTLPRVTTHDVAQGSATAADTTVAGREGLLVDGDKIEENTHLTADNGDNHVGVFNGVDICDPKEGADIAVHPEATVSGPLDQHVKQAVKADAPPLCDLY